MKSHQSSIEHIKKGFLNGLGWSIGTTVGFALVVTIIVNLIKFAGGLPVVGGFFASVVESTQQSLLQHTSKN